MDIFCEYMVKKRKTPMDYFFQFLCLFAGLTLTLLVFLMFFGRLMGFETFIIAGIWFGVVVLIRKTNLEIEYILTNSVMDIDKIMSQKTRRRVISIDFSKIEDFGKKTEHTQDSQGAKVLDLSADINGSDVYFVDFFKDSEKFRVYFSPSENILKNLRNANPRMIKLPEGIE